MSAKNSTRHVGKGKAARDGTASAKFGFGIQVPCTGGTTCPLSDRDDLRGLLRSDQGDDRRASHVIEKRGDASGVVFFEHRSRGVMQRRDQSHRKARSQCPDNRRVPKG